MGSSQHDEVERTYDAGPAVILPTLADVDGVSTMDQAVEHQWEAVYFDTADLILAQHRTALRRRTGGGDAGWDQSFPTDEGPLTEAHRPLGRATKTAPKGLLAPVRALVRDHPLVPVVRVSTRRLETHSEVRTAWCLPGSATTTCAPSGCRARPGSKAGATGRSSWSTVNRLYLTGSSSGCLRSAPPPPQRWRPSSREASARTFLLMTAALAASHLARGRETSCPRAVPPWSCG